MSEELRQKGYLTAAGQVRGDAVDGAEGFNIGATTLNQLNRAGVVPSKTYGRAGTKKPDGLVVDRADVPPVVRLVVEYKDRGEIDSQTAQDRIIQKVVDDYCGPLSCSIAAISDRRQTTWVCLDPDSGVWKRITREDGYPMDDDVDLSTPEGREAVARSLRLIHEQLDLTEWRTSPADPG